MTEKEVNKALGARVRQLRIIRNMTQAQVAKSYRGKAAGAQSMYERGDRGISIYRLLQLAEILQITPTAWLLSDDGWNDLMAPFDMPLVAAGRERV